MDSATTAAAGEKPIIFQAMATTDDETMVMRNIWLIIKATPQKGIFRTLEDIGLPEDEERFGSALLGTSSIFVKSSLCAVGGRKPNSDELSSCIHYLDANKLSEGWKVKTLPFPSFDSVLGVYDDSIYILPVMWKSGYYGTDDDTYREKKWGYIWNTIDNKCLNIETPPDGGKGWWRRIRACASLDQEGLLIAMDGEENNFFLYNTQNDWKIYDTVDPLPNFIGETSFAASNGRLYILEVRSMSPAFLYIYDIKKRKLVMDKKPVPKFDDDLWSMDKWDRVVRLVPVAEDKLCFLWLGPVTYEKEDMWHPVRILHHLKVKFSINPNPSDSEVKVEDDKGFRTNITNLLDCLPCSYPEQFEAELEGRSPLYPQLDASQEQRTDNSSAEEIGTCLISGKKFQNQAKDIASPIEKGKRKRTQLVDPPLSRHEQKRAKMEEGLKRKTQMAELKKKLGQLEKDSIVFRFEAQLNEARLNAEVSEARLKAEAALREAKLEAALREAKLEAAVRQAELEAEVTALEAVLMEELEAGMWERRFQQQIREVGMHQNRFDKMQVSQGGEWKLQVLQGGEWEKNEEPSSTIYETVSPSEVPKQQHITAEPQTKPSSQYSYSRGVNIPDITATDKEMPDGRALKREADRKYRERIKRQRQEIMLENERLAQENASLKARMDELLKRSAELEGEEEKEQYKDTSANPVPPEASSRQRIKSVQAKIRELQNRLAELIEKELHSVGEKGTEQNKDTSANPVPPEASSRQR